ncbi:MAG: zinc ribbon domain-containing protein [Deltaproteobacteria bacterium]|nr:zinc ribbon domain-containing protein [Deltaproteobacteria bacterium]
MPIYEYFCQSCGCEFEEWQKITDLPVDKCRRCGGKASRLISRSSFVLKGTGWYVTDYGRKDCGGGRSDSKCHSGSCGSDSESCAASKETKSSESSD